MKKSKRLKNIQTAIEYTLNTPTVQEELGKVGFSGADVMKGKAQLAQVRLLDSAQRKEYGDRYQATDNLNQARAEARHMYNKHLEGARYALREHRGYYEMLDLAGPRKDDLFGWLAQAHTFYDNVPQVKKILAQYNLSMAELEQGKSMINTVMDAYNRQRKEAVEAQTATQQRNQAMKEADAWMSRFKRAARMAFADDPQTLKGLGLLSKVEA